MKTNKSHTTEEIQAADDYLYKQKPTKQFRNAFYAGVVWQKEQEKKKQEYVSLIHENLVVIADLVATSLQTSIIGIEKKTGPYVESSIVKKTGPYNTEI